MKPVRVLVLVLLAMGCAKKSVGSLQFESAGYRGPSYDEGGYGMEDMEQDAPPPKTSSRGRPASAPPPPPPPPSVEPAYYVEEMSSYDEPAPEPVDEPEDASPDRMIHYDGYARVRTPRSEELVESVIGIATEAGGHVESRSLSRVTVRVPVATFDASWQAILDLGPVVSRHLGAEDVTDAFSDMDMRVKSLRTMRDRLAVLLAQAKTEEEKLALIQQIHRLTEQIEVIDAQLTALRDLASFSRITVESEAPDLHAGASVSLPAGMGWIDRLSAFDHYLHDLGRPVKLAVPQGFVRLDPRHYHVQAADGAVVWAGTLLNDPTGSGDFWRSAVIDRIGEQLEDGAQSTVGGWSMVRFVEPGADEPYVWHLAFRPDGKFLQVFQVTYPDEEQEQRYHDAVLAILKGGEA